MNLKLLSSVPRSAPGFTNDFTYGDPDRIGAGHFTVNVSAVKGTPVDVLIDDHPSRRQSVGASLAVYVQGRESDGSYRTLVRFPDITIPGRSAVDIDPDTRTFSGVTDAKVQAKLPEVFRLAYDITGNDAEFTFAADAVVL